MTKAVTVAREFLRIAREDDVALTNMQVQKLVYIAHGIHMATKDCELLDEEVSAWKHGPVIPEVYYALKQYLNKNIDLVKEAPESQLVTTDEIESIILAYDNFSKYSGWKLREVTHIKGSPWHKIWYDGNGNETFNAEIPNSVIKSHYKEIFRTRKVTAL